MVDSAGNPRPFRGELWLVAEKGQEQEALAARAPCKGAKTPDGHKGLAVFTSKDAAESFIHEIGEATTARPALFESEEQFHTFLRAWLAGSFTYVVLDPSGTPGCDEQVWPTAAILQGIGSL